MPDILEVGRRLKLSFNGYITYRKLAGILLLLLFFFLYLGLGIMAWLTDYVMGTLTQVQCVAEGIPFFRSKYGHCPNWLNPPPSMWLLFSSLLSEVPYWLL